MISSIAQEYISQIPVPSGYVINPNYSDTEYAEYLDYHDYSDGPETEEDD